MEKNILFSSFGKWLAPICTKTFIDRVTHAGQYKCIKKLTTLAYFKLFLHAELQGRDELRDIADDVLCEDIQKELGLETISAAQLCRKQNQVDPALLEQVFASLVERIHSQSSSSILRRTFKIIDSTTFGKTKSGSKIHTRIAFVNEDDVVQTKPPLRWQRQ